MRPTQIAVLLAGALLFLAPPLQAAPQLAGAMSGLSAAGSAVAPVRDWTYRRSWRYRDHRLGRPHYDPRYRLYYYPRYHGYGWTARRYHPPRFGSYEWWEAHDWFRRR